MSSAWEEVMRRECEDAELAALAEYDAALKRAIGAVAASAAVASGGAADSAGKDETPPLEVDTRFGSWQLLPCG